jgi:hypothetical protein
LYKLIQPFHDFISPEKMDMLDRLESVYTEARYPNELGLLPSGKPTSTQAYNLLDCCENRACQNGENEIGNKNATSNHRNLSNRSEVWSSIS